MDIIKESSIEDVDDTETKSYSLETSNGLFSYVAELVLQS